ncbi:MAG: hypothetical protein ABW170_17315 [Candidatus Thiodiazotropha sp. L084R]
MYTAGSEVFNSSEVTNKTILDQTRFVDSVIVRVTMSKNNRLAVVEGALLKCGQYFCETKSGSCQCIT